MANIIGYIGYDIGNSIITDAYGSVILFKTPDHAEQHGNAWRVVRVCKSTTRKKLDPAKIERNLKNS